MRSAKLTFEEIQAAEQAADARRKSRNQGFAKMHERDKASQVLSNGVTMLWHVDKELNKETTYLEKDNGEMMEITIYPDEMPEDCFGLLIDGKRYIFNLEEFRKYLRWA